MSWASHPTAEMPTEPAGATPALHRARRRGLIGVVSVAGLVALAAGAMFAPTLIGWPPPSRSAAGSAVTATATADVSGTTAAPPTPTRDASTPPVASPTAQAVRTSRPVSVADSAALEAQVLALTNTERVTYGCAELRLDSNLAVAARAHSVEMAATGVFGHPGQDGSDPGQRMREAGYDTSAGWAENIARGQATASAVMAAWMGSDAHRSNILDCEMKAIGVGAARDGTGQLYWTQDFGRN